MTLLASHTTDAVSPPSASDDTYLPEVETSRSSPRVWVPGILLATSVATSALSGITVPAYAGLLNDQSSNRSAAIQSGGRFWLATRGRSYQLALKDTEETVNYVHSRSGLTWEQLARILGVSRRSVHMWAAGGRMTARHFELLTDLARLIHSAPAHSSTDVRTWLFSGMGPSAKSPLDELMARHRRGGAPLVGSGYTPRELLRGNEE